MHSNAGWSTFHRKQNAEDSRALAGERLARELAKGPKCRICGKPLAAPEGQYGGVHRICAKPDKPEQTEDRHWTDWSQGF